MSGAQPTLPNLPLQSPDLRLSINDLNNLTINNELVCAVQKILKQPTCCVHRMNASDLWDYKKNNSGPQTFENWLILSPTGFHLGQELWEETSTRDGDPIQIQISKRQCELLDSGVGENLSQCPMNVADIEAGFFGRAVELIKLLKARDFLQLELPEDGLNAAVLIGLLKEAEELYSERYAQIKGAHPKLAELIFGDESAESPIRLIQRALGLTRNSSQIFRVTAPWNAPVRYESSEDTFIKIGTHCVAIATAEGVFVRTYVPGTIVKSQPLAPRGFVPEDFHEMSSIGIDTASMEKTIARAARRLLHLLENNQAQGGAIVDELSKVAQLKQAA